MWAQFKTNGLWHKIEGSKHSVVVFKTSCGLRIKSYSFNVSDELEPLLEHNRRILDDQMPICPKCKGQHVIDLIK